MFKRKFMTSGVAGLREGGTGAVLRYMIKANLSKHFLPFFPREPRDFRESSTSLGYTQTKKPDSTITICHPIEAALPSDLLTLEFFGSTFPIDTAIERGHTVYLTINQDPQRDTTLFVRVTPPQASTVPQLWK